MGSCCSKPKVKDEEEKEVCTYVYKQDVLLLLWYVCAIMYLDIHV